MEPMALAHFVDGERRSPRAAATVTVSDPHTGDPVALVPSGDDAGVHADVDAAVAAARAAQRDWARRPAGERAEILWRSACHLRAHAGVLAARQSAEMGKLPDDSRGGVEAGISTLEQFAQLGPLHRGHALVGAWNATDMMVHVPRGVAAVVTPWNDPVAIMCQGIAANLAVGNTVVVKPSERAPLSAVELVELLDLPPGVCNLVLGDGPTGRALVAHPDVDVVLHTGSVATGRAISQVCAGTPKKAVLELGGKDALIVDSGVDPAWAASQAAVGAFANAGQICTAVERIYVMVELASPFLDHLEKEAEAFETGPLVDRVHRHHVHGHVRRAVQDGARVLVGGQIPEGPGAWYPPTVVTDVPDDTPLMVEETFGPVAPVRTVTSFDEAMELAADSPFGLAATVLTPSQDHAQRAWRELPVGTVKINAVFGGAPGGAAEPHGSSGTGFGYGPELLNELTRTRVVHSRAYAT